MGLSARLINDRRLQIEVGQGDNGVVNITKDFLSDSDFDGFSKIDLRSLSSIARANIELDDDLIDASSGKGITLHGLLGQEITLSSGSVGDVYVQGGITVYLGDDQFNRVFLKSDGITGRLIGGTGGAYLKSFNDSDIILAGSGDDTIVSYHGGDDLFSGGAGNDVFKFSGSTLNGQDTIIGGYGRDKLIVRVKSDDYNFDTSELKISGIEEVRFSGNQDYSVTAKIDNNFINSSEVDSVVLNSGSLDVTLDASGLSDNNIVRLKGTGDIRLIDGVEHRVGGVNNGDGVEVYGGNENDYFRSYNKGDAFHGGEGNDVFSDWGKEDNADYFDGGVGNDTFGARIGRLTSADTFDGGEGSRDRILYGIDKEEFSLDAADQLGNVTGIEIIQLRNKLEDGIAQSDVNVSIRLTKELLSTAANEEFTIKNGGFDINLDTTDLALDQTVNVTGSGSVSVETGSVNTVVIASNEGGNDDGSQTIYVGEEEGVTIAGGEGNDNFFMGNGVNVVVGGGGSDRFFNVGEVASTIEGGDGDDTFFLTGNMAIVNGGAGNDIIIAQTEGVDFSQIHGGDGVDSIELSAAGVVGLGGFSFYSTGLEVFIDGDLSSFVDGGTSAQAVNIDGNDGDDHLLGSAGNDTIAGGSGNDSLKGADGDDIMLGGAGNDELIGGAGNDSFVGGANDDKIYGDGGDDIIDLTEGTDTVEGGEGSDSFRISLLTDNAEINDFALEENDIFSFVNAPVEMLVIVDIGSVSEELAAQTAAHADNLADNTHTQGYVYVHDTDNDGAFIYYDQDFSDTSNAMNEIAVVDYYYDNNPVTSITTASFEFI